MTLAAIIVLAFLAWLAFSFVLGILVGRVLAGRS